MTREEMVEKAFEALKWEHVKDGDYYQERLIESDAEIREMAESVVDAILPQLTTVEELEALQLPNGSILTTHDGIVLFWRARVQMLRAGLVDHEPADVLTDGPLTVVWLP